MSDRWLFWANLDPRDLDGELPKPHLELSDGTDLPFNCLMEWAAEELDPFQEDAEIEVTAHCPARNSWHRVELVRGGWNFHRSDETSREEILGETEGP